MKTKIGRNEPCSCGSGKKYKKCCMNKKHSNPKSSQSIVWVCREPKVLRKELKNGKLVLFLDWYGMGTGKTIITKTQSGYNYEDVGIMKRSFSDVSSMLWEFELPKSLKETIETLPTVLENKYELELTNKGENGFKNQFDNLFKYRKVG